MSDCVYPNCRGPVDASLEGRGGQWCLEHEGVKCSYPPCQELVMPRSGFCQAHNDQTIYFDWVHGLRHAQAQEVMQLQQVMQKLQTGRQGNRRGGLHIAGR